MAKASSLACPNGNFTSQKVWDTARAQELYGGSPASEGRKILLRNARSILQKVQNSIENHVSMSGLLSYISQKNELLSDTEVYHLKRRDFSAKQKALLLVNYIADSKKTPVERLYLCLLDSYTQPGMEGHYIVAQQLRDCALRAIKKKTVIKEIEEIVNDIVNVPLRADIARQLLSLLEVQSSQAVSLPADLHSLCQLWFSSKCDLSLEVLVQALLCTPSLGYLVTGLASICESNPPEVWKFVARIGNEWSALALFMGYNSGYISALKSQFPSLEDQLHHFLRVWRVPDCKARTAQILARLSDAFKVHQSGSGSVSGGAGHAEPEVPQDSSLLLEEESLMSQSSVEPEEVPWSPQPPKALASEPLLSPWSDLAPQEPDTDKGLVEACANKNWELADLLVHPGALECKDEKGCTPLHICCKEEQTEIVLKLIDCGACLTAANAKGNTCLHLSEVLMNNRMLAVLLDAFRLRDITVDQRNWGGMSPLLIACLIGDSCIEGVKALLEAGADVNGNEQALFRPLTAACAGGHERVVKLLLHHRANLNVQDKDGRTPLTCSCQGYAFGISKLLLRVGADAKIASKRALTALHVCAEKNAIELAEILLDNGADPNRIVTVTDPRNITGTGEVEETPLTCACSRGHLKMVELLCNYGANVNELCSGIVPPIGFAIISRQHHIVEYLVELPQFDNNFSALAAPVHIAVRCQNYVCIPYLMQKCQNSTTGDALLYASQNNLRELQEGIQRFYDANGGSCNEETCMETMRADIHEKRNEANHWSPSVLSGELYLNRLCQIVVNILRYKPNIEIEALAETAFADGHTGISSLLLQCLDFSLDPLALKTEFLLGPISALRFVLRLHVITMEDFYAGVQRYYPDDVEDFCTKLVMTFHEVNGGHELPFDTQACLKKLISGGFVPAVSRTQVCGGGEYEQAGIVNDPAAERRAESDGFPGVGHVLSSGVGHDTEQVTVPKEDIPKLSELMELVAPLSDWFVVGTYLELEHGRLRLIEQEYHMCGTYRCNIQMFHLWLDWCAHPTWEAVAEALQHAQVHEKARKVREKHCWKGANEGGRETERQESQSERMPDAAQHRSTPTTNTTSSSPPNNSKAIPNEPWDNRFARSTSQTASSTEGANDLSHTSPHCSPFETEQQRCVESDGTHNVQKPSPSKQENPTTRKSFPIESKEKTHDPMNINFDDKEKEKADEADSGKVALAVTMERSEDIPSSPQVRKLNPGAGPGTYMVKSPPYHEPEACMAAPSPHHQKEDRARNVKPSKHQKEALFEYKVEEQEDIDMVITPLVAVLEKRLQKGKYHVKVTLHLSDARS